MTRIELAMLAFIACVAGTVISTWAYGAAPPENADPALAPWYRSLKQPGSGVSCCSIADCRPVDYRTDNGAYEVFIDDKWRTVPPDKVLQQMVNPVGRAVVCYTPALGILCFVRAAEI